MTDRPRILSLFGGVVLLGQERGNIEALLALKEQGCESLCLIRDEQWITKIPDALDAHGLAWKKMPFLVKWKRGLVTWAAGKNLVTLVRANLRFLKIVHRFRPTHILAFNQTNVLTFLPGLCVVRTPLIYRAGDEPTLHNRFWRLTWRFVCYRTTRFIAVSGFIKGSLQNAGVAAQRIDVICNRPPTRVADGQVTPDLPQEPSTWIIYVGQIIPQKGADILLEAFKIIAPEFPHLGVVVLGRISEWDGDWWGRELSARVRRDDVISRRVVFAGDVENIGIYFRRSLVHVAPSVWQEPLGNVVLEAKQHGVPSVVFPSGGLPEMIRQDIDGHICSEPTASALASALRIYANDPAIARRQGEAAMISLESLGVGSFSRRWMEILRRSETKP